MGESAILYHLQQIDLDILDIQKQLQEVQSQLGETEELRQTRNSLHTIKEQSRIWRTKQKESELVLESLVQKIEQGEQRLYSGKVRNPKELYNLQHELTSLKQRRSEKEEEVLGAMVQVDELASAREKARVRLASVISAWEKTQTLLNDEQETLQARLAKLQNDRKRVVDSISRDNLSTYDYLRNRKAGHAVALLKDGVCQGCRISVSVNKRRDVETNHALIACGNCGRILCSAG